MLHRILTFTLDDKDKVNIKHVNINLKFISVITASDEEDFFIVKMVDGSVYNISKGTHTGLINALYAERQKYGAIDLISEIQEEIYANIKEILDTKFNKFIADNKVEKNDKSRSKPSDLMYDPYTDFKYKPLDKTKEHYLKCVQPYYQDCLDGKKKFDIRINDREYTTGDILIFREYIPAVEELTLFGYYSGVNHYTGRTAKYRVTYLLQNEEFGITPGYCIMGIELIPNT